jgi:viroplasmin and RNaseH domain-containing protein
MAKKVYVVWHGKETGVFTEWQKSKESIQLYNCNNWISK